MSQVLNISGSGGGSGSVTSISAADSTLTLTPNPIIATGTIGLNTTNITTTNGTIYWNGTTLATTATGTAGQVLTSNGVGVAPTYQAQVVSAVTSIAGTVNQITASAATGAVTLSIPTTFTAPGSITANSGNITITSGNLVLPVTTSTVGQVFQNSFRLIHTFGTRNIFPGRNAGNFTLTGSNNVGIGISSLIILTSGINNTAVGQGSGINLQSGQRNTLVGSGAGGSLTTTSDNTMIGHIVGNGNLGTNNVFIGYSAGNPSINTSNNVFIGKSTGQNYTGAVSVSNILLGTEIRGTVGDANTLRVGLSTGSAINQLNKSFISGIFGTTIDVSGIPIVVDNTNQLGTVVSSKRYKENILNLSSISNDIYKLKPIVFNYKKDKHKSMCYGLIAEEVEEIIPNIVVKNDNNQPETVKYLDLIPMLLKEVQILRKELNELRRT